MMGEDKGANGMLPIWQDFDRMTRNVVSTYRLQAIFPGHLISILSVNTSVIASTTPPLGLLGDAFLSNMKIDMLIRPMIVYITLWWLPKTDEKTMWNQYPVIARWKYIQSGLSILSGLSVEKIIFCLPSMEPTIAHKTIWKFVVKKRYHSFLHYYLLMSSIIAVTVTDNIVRCYFHHINLQKFI